MARKHCVLLLFLLARRLLIAVITIQVHIFRSCALLSATPVAAAAAATTSATITCLCATVAAPTTTTTAAACIKRV